MKESQFFRQGASGCFITLVVVMLTLWALVFSVKYQYPEAPPCNGMLGAGFPILFICDDWGGGSPTGSWGKIDFIDVVNGGIQPQGLLFDFLFYMALIWGVGFIASGLFSKGKARTGLGLAALISLGFIAGFLCAFWLFQSSRLYRGGFHYSPPTPIANPTATPLGTMPATIAPDPYP